MGMLDEGTVTTWPQLHIPTQVCNLTLILPPMSSKENGLKQTLLCRNSHPDPPNLDIFFQWIGGKEIGRILTVSASHASIVVTDSQEVINDGAMVFVDDVFPHVETSVK